MGDSIYGTIKKENRIGRRRDYICHNGFYGYCKCNNNKKVSWKTS